MLYKSFFLLITLVLTLNIACSEDVNSTISNSPITETDAVKKANQLSTGTVTKTELTTHNGIKVWEVYMTTSSGGELKIKFCFDDGTMIEIKRNSPSYVKEFRPGIKPINYCTARSVAMNAKNVEIVG
jgi:hypothetical protein